MLKFLAALVVAGMAARDFRCLAADEGPHVRIVGIRCRLPSETAEGMTDLRASHKARAERLV